MDKIQKWIEDMKCQLQQQCAKIQQACKLPGGFKLPTNFKLPGGLKIPGLGGGGGGGGGGGDGVCGGGGGGGGGRGGGGGGAGRMKFPYTFTAKMVQFPITFHMKHNWIWRYYPYGILVGLPVFIKLHVMSNSANNKKVWAEIRRKEKEGHH